MQRHLLWLSAVILCASLSLSCTRDASNNGASDAGADSADISGEDGTSAPRVADITVEPESIAKSQTGMTDEYFTITVNLEEATSAPEELTVFVEMDSGTRASFGEVASSSSEQVVLENVTYSWLGGLGVGEYSVGATVKFEGREQVTQTGLGTVEVVAQGE